MSQEKAETMAISINAMFSGNHSSIQKIDPRARIICSFMFALAVVLSRDIPALLMALSCSLAMVYMARLPVLSTLKKMAAMDSFMLYLMVLLPFTVPGEVMVVVWGYEGSWQGLEQAIQITLKANAVVLMLFATVSIIPSSVLGSALSSLQVNMKLIQLLLFTMRYLTVIAQEYARLRRSMKARAFVMRFNWHSWKSIGYLIAMLLVRSMQRSQRIINCMKCRGFSGKYISYYPLQWQLKDTRYCLAMALFIMLIISINFVGGL